MKDTLTFLVQTLLQKNNITLDIGELDFQIKSHPSYPSLHAITGVLTHFNIEHLALEVPKNEETLAQLPKSFLAQIQNETGSHFVHAINYKGSKYKLVFNEKKYELVSLQEFLKQFTGIVVAVEKSEKQQPVKTKQKNYANALLFIAIALFILIFFSLNPGRFASIHFILSIIGVSISILIIQHDLGIHSKVLDSICSQEGNATNCNAVLNSNGAKLFHNIKLSDMSFIYFTAVSLSWFLISLMKTTYNPLLLLSLIAFPVVFYSIYYQVFISKSWCKLCLGIATILTIQAFLFLVFPVQFSNVTSIVFSAVLLTFSIISISVLWLFIASLLKKEKEFNNLKIESTKFKRNFDLFNTLLEKSNSIDTEIPNIAEIVFGNKKASLNITLITNPFCGHCKEVHSLVEEILIKHHKDVTICIRFNINTNETASDVVKITSRLLELYHTQGEAKCLDAMHDIYNNHNAKQWLKKWNTCEAPDHYIAVLLHVNNWCKTHNINFTPKLLINGKSFPKAYDRSDLIYFIEDLHEASIEQINITELQLTT